MLAYKELIQEEVEELQRLEKRQRRSAVSYRVRMLRLLKSGECRSIASVAKEPEFWVSKAEGKYLLYVE